jgi:hypothetical protein
MLKVLTEPLLVGNEIARLERLDASSGADGIPQEQVSVVTAFVIRRLGELPIRLDSGETIGQDWLELTSTDPECSLHLADVTNRTGLDIASEARNEGVRSPTRVAKGEVKACAATAAPRRFLGGETDRRARDYFVARTRI